MHSNAPLLAAAGPLSTSTPAGVAVPAAQGAAAPPPVIPDISMSWGSYFEALAILCFVLAALWAVLWYLKRKGGGSIFPSSAPTMRIENRLALGPKKWLYIVRCMEERLVLGVTDKHITLVSQSPLEEEEILADASRGLFGRKDKNAKGKIFVRKQAPENAPAGNSPEAPSSFDAFLKDETGNTRL